MSNVLSVARFQDSTTLIDQPLALRNQAEQDGYVFLRDLLPRRRVEALRDVALKSCAELGWLAPDNPPGDVLAKTHLGLGASDDPRYHAFLAQVIPSMEFAVLGENPTLLSVVAAVSGSSVKRRHADICRVFSPDSDQYTTLPHQDHHYLGGPDPGWTVWIPLVNCPLSHGPLAVVRASHRRGLQAHRDDGKAKYIAEPDMENDLVSGDMVPGDAVIFHGRTIHLALPNRSGSRLRLSADFRYLPA